MKENSQRLIEKSYEFIVVGGGMSGICAAIAAARGGVKTALIHDRPVLGGNASSEIRMHICGADSHGKFENARETGLIEEILLENKYRNPDNAYPIFDSILWEKTHFQENLTLYLNTHMTEVYTEENTITSINARQLTSETNYVFTGKYFADTTGDGSLSQLAGASYMFGREATATFNEPHAPEVADNICMGNSLLFKTVDTGKPVRYIKPHWANTYTEDDLVHRQHGASGYNYWWIELGGGEDSTITDSEIIRDQLLKATYGVWDHIKNGGDHGADNYVLDWMGFLPGKRESRRIIGDYVLNENDLSNCETFYDAVAYGGWPMDMHVPGGLKAKLEPTDFIHVNEPYQIPYRCLYSKDINNLFMAGRILSASHMAFGSTRVMATCATLGQAIGTAARFLDENTKTPRDVLSRIEELQQQLLRDDAYIPGVPTNDNLNLAPKLTLEASSTKDDCYVNNIIDGYQRSVKSDKHYWSSSNEETATVSFTSQEEIMLSSIEIKFDSNLSEEIRMSMFNKHIPKRNLDMPTSLVKTYEIEFLKDNKQVSCISVNDNHLRHNVHTLTSPVYCDQVNLICKETYGDPDYKIFEVRLY